MVGGGVRPLFASLTLALLGCCAVECVVGVGNSDNALYWSVVGTDVPFEAVVHMVRLDDGCLYHFHNDAARSQRNHRSCDGGATWTQLPSYPSPARSDFAVCAANGNIYLIAGSTDGRGRGFVSSVLSSSDGRSWTSAAQYPSSQGFHSCATHPSTGDIYTLAGCCPYKSELRRFNGNSWSTVTSAIGYERRAFSPIAILDNGYMFTGAGDRYYGPTRYTHETDLWRSTDGGKSWSRLCRMNTCDWYQGSSEFLIALYAVENTLYLGVRSLLFASHDFGASFTRVQELGSPPGLNWNGRHPAIDSATGRIYAVAGNSMYVGSTRGPHPIALPHISAGTAAVGPAEGKSSSNCTVHSTFLTAATTIATEDFEVGTRALLLRAQTRVTVIAPSVIMNSTGTTTAAAGARCDSGGPVIGSGDDADGTGNGSRQLLVCSPLVLVEAPEFVVKEQQEDIPCSTARASCNDDGALVLCAPEQVVIRGRLASIAGAS